MLSGGPRCSLMSVMQKLVVYFYSRSHWLSIFQSSPLKIEFFDSFGRHPKDFGFSFPPHYQLIYNTFALQSFDSNVCGQYCIYYLYFRSLGYSLQEIIHHLSALGHSQSDIHVSSQYQRLLRSHRK